MFPAKYHLITEVDIVLSDSSYSEVSLVDPDYIMFGNVTSKLAYDYQLPGMECREFCTIDYESGGNVKHAMIPASVMSESKGRQALEMLASLESLRDVTIVCKSQKPVSLSWASWICSVPRLRGLMLHGFSAIQQFSKRIDELVDVFYFEADASDYDPDAIKEIENWTSLGFLSLTGAATQSSRISHLFRPSIRNLVFLRISVDGLHIDATSIVTKCPMLRCLEYDYSREFEEELFRANPACVLRKPDE
jgi:hypothetical protein